MSILDNSAMQAAYKELYDSQKVADMAFAKNPFLALIPKSTDFFGEYYPVPIQFSSTNGRSANFAQAQANQSAPAMKKFLVTRVQDYSIGTIARETLQASANDKGAFISGLKLMMNSAMTTINNSMSSAVFRNGTGSIAQISAISTGVITLVDPSNTTQFQVGMALQAAATDGGTPRAASGYVISVVRTGPNVSVTVSASAGGSAGTPSSWAANDYLLVAGDSNAKMSGLLAWLPASDPQSGDNFYGVDRSADPVKLAGLRYDGSGLSIEEALTEGSVLLDREGGSPNFCIVNHASWSALQKSLGSKIQYVDLKSGSLGFQGIQIQGASGPITVMADRMCPAKTAFLLTLDTWELKSLGEAPHIQEDLVTGDLLRVYNADAGEARISFYGNVICREPGHNANVKLAA